MTFGPTTGLRHRRFGFTAADVITYTYMGIGLLVVTMNIGVVIWAWWWLDGAPYQSVPSVDDSWLTRLLLIPTSTDMLQKRAGLSLLLVLLAGLLDGIDGPIARWRKTAAPRGEDLDGMADTVAFGMAPAATLWATAVLSQVQQQYVLTVSGGTPEAIGALPSVAWYPFIWIACGLFVGAMQWRLRASHHTGWTHFVFRGLPAPGAGLILITLAVLWDNAEWSGSRLKTTLELPDLPALAANSAHYVYLALAAPIGLAIYMTTPIPAVKMNRAGRYQFTLDLLILAAFAAVMVWRKNLLESFATALATYVAVGLVFGVLLLRSHGRRQRAESAALAVASGLGAPGSAESAASTPDT